MNYLYKYIYFIFKINLLYNLNKYYIIKIINQYMFFFQGSLI
jgi:hypothetical protein